MLVARACQAARPLSHRLVIAVPEEKSKLDEIERTAQKMRSDLENVQPDAIKQQLNTIETLVRDLRAVQRELEPIQNVVLTPVSDKLVELLDAGEAQFEQGTRQSILNRRIGIAGTIIGAVGIGLVLVNYVRDDPDISAIKSNIGTIDSQIEAMGSELDSLEDSIGAIDERVTLALREQLDPINREGLKPVEGEIPLSQNNIVTLLSNETHSLQVVVRETGLDKTEGHEPWMYARVAVLADGGELSDAIVEDIVSISRLRPEIPVDVAVRWREGDVITFYGLYTFTVTRILSTRLSGRDRADPNDAMYVRAAQGSR